MTSVNPFLPTPDERDPNRRFRGRLAAPVTIVTAGSDDRRTGLTVSSLLVVEGEPGEIHMVVGPTSDLWDVLAETGRCVIHVARPDDGAISDVFAGLRPSPGGVFAGTETRASPWGPVLVDLADRAYCSLLRMDERGWSGLVSLAIDQVELTDLTDALVYFRGGYRRLR